METTMTRESTYSPVGFGGAFAEQFRLLWATRRPLLLLVGLLGALALAGEPWKANQVARIFEVWPLWLLLVGPFWAFVVWYQEGPSTRLYFWSHPVSRTNQTLARVAAGAAWLWVLYGALVLVALLLAAIDGNMAQLGMMSFQGWLALFLSPILGYLILSIITVPSDYPTRWFLGLVLGLPLVLSLLDEWLEINRFLSWILTPVGDDRWGLITTMIAPFMLGVREVKTALGFGTYSSGSSFDPGLWWVTASLWLLALIGLIAFVATRHPDTFPRLRRQSS